MKRTVAMCTYVSNYLSFFCELVSAVEANNGNANCCNVFVLIFSPERIFGRPVKGFVSCRLLSVCNVFFLFVVF